MTMDRRIRLLVCSSATSDCADVCLSDSISHNKIMQLRPAALLAASCGLAEPAVAEPPFCPALLPVTALSTPIVTAAAKAGFLHHI